MSAGEKNNIIWWYGWNKDELAKLLSPAVAECHIRSGSTHSSGTHTHYFKGSRQEINLVRSHLLLESIFVEKIAARLWSCNRNRKAKVQRPHLMMGKPKVMNITGTISGRIKNGNYER